MIESIKKNLPKKITNKKGKIKKKQIHFSNKNEMSLFF